MTSPTNKLRKPNQIPMHVFETNMYGRIFGKHFLNGRVATRDAVWIKKLKKSNLFKSGRVWEITAEEPEVPEEIAPEAPEVLSEPVELEHETKPPVDEYEGLDAEQLKGLLTEKGIAFHPMTKDRDKLIAKLKGE